MGVGDGATRHVRLLRLIRTSRGITQCFPIATTQSSPPPPSTAPPPLATISPLHADIAYFAGAEHKAPARLDERIWDGLLAKHTIAADTLTLRID